MVSVYLLVHQNLYLIRFFSVFVGVQNHGFSVFIGSPKRIFDEVFSLFCCSPKQIYFGEQFVLVNSPLLITTIGSFLSGYNDPRGTRAPTPPGRVRACYLLPGPTGGAHDVPGLVPVQRGLERGHRGGRVRVSVHRQHLQATVNTGPQKFVPACFCPISEVCSKRVQV